MSRVYVTAAQHAVDEDAQFGILERPLRKITPLAGVHYVRPHFHKTGHIPANRLSLSVHSVIFVQKVDYFALRQRVLRVRIFVKHLIKSDYERLFGLQRHIPLLFHFIIESPAFQRFRPTPSPPLFRQYTTRRHAPFSAHCLPVVFVDADLPPLYNRLRMSK